MPIIRIVAAAAAITAGLTLTAAAATNCPAGVSACEASSIAATGTPLRLNQFVKPSRQVKIAGTKAKTRTAQSAGKTRARAAAKGASAMASSPRPASPPRQEAVSEGAQPPASTAQQAIEAKESNGVAITSADEVNELDAAALPAVQVVAANEVNELDLAADAAPATTVTSDNAAVQNAEPAPAPAADNSWIGKLLAALGGMVAIASAARLLIA
jgi:hypothetical protein